jgi:hypothetical protein
MPGPSNPMKFFFNGIYGCYPNGAFDQVSNFVVYVSFLFKHHQNETGIEENHEAGIGV